MSKNYLFLKVLSTFLRKSDMDPSTCPEHNKIINPGNYLWVRRIFQNYETKHNFKAVSIASTQGKGGAERG